MPRFQSVFCLFLTFTCLFAFSGLLQPDHVFAESKRQGRVTGGKGIKSFPGWFKESFLEIEEDAIEAAESGKHLLLFMHLENCPYCFAVMDESFKKSSFVPYIKEHFDAVEINIRGDREVTYKDETQTEKQFARNSVKVRYTPTILFFNGDAEIVLRLNGYRSAETMEHIFHFVHEKAYDRTDLASFIEERELGPAYTFRDHVSFSDIKDLSSVKDKPLAVMFEDKMCDECDALHDGILKMEDTRKYLKKFTVVRLDAYSSEKIIDVQGNPTTPRDLANNLKLNYRPGFVFFDEGKEIKRIDGMLRTYHFQGVLRYVGERHYKTHKRFYGWLGTWRKEILNSGKNIDLWK